MKEKALQLLNGEAQKQTRCFEINKKSQILLKTIKHIFMNDKAIKSAFVSGEMVTINGKSYTRMYTEEDLEERKKNPATLSSKEMDKLMGQTMKDMFPDLHRRQYPEQYKD